MTESCDTFRQWMTPEKLCVSMIGFTTQVIDHIKDPYNSIG